MKGNDRWKELDDAARQGRGGGLIGEFLEFIVHNKKWWMIPILVVLLAMGALIFLSSTSAAPFIYTLF